MYIKENKNFLEVSGVKDFEIGQTLECGQCFRFHKNGEKDYTIIAGGKLLDIKQKGDSLIFSPMSEEEFVNYWVQYFDLNRDYSHIKNQISKNDPIMEEAIEYAPGIRILNQDFWECMISFIISQNNRIPMIKKVIENLSRAYGKEIDKGFAFPQAEDLQSVTVEEFMTHKTGFRAKYIKDAVEKRLSGNLDEKKLETIEETQSLRKELSSVYGVGNKVADCVMLFGLKRKEVFPSDVWIKRVISELYFEGEEIPLNKLQAFACEKWGENAGFAQQYLFHYARMNKVGTSK